MARERAVVVGAGGICDAWFPPLIREKIGTIPGMHRTRTTIVLTTLKETSGLSLESLTGRSP